MTLEAITTLLVDHFGPAMPVTPVPQARPSAIEVPGQHIAEIGHWLQTHDQLYFDYLACLTAIDNGPEAGTLALVYQLYSIPYHIQLMLHVTVERNLPGAPLPQVPSVSHIWRSADWYEREAYDLVGIHFTGHPDLRRILLPADWEGYPLRKDYEAQEEYHGVEV